MFLPRILREIIGGLAYINPLYYTVYPSRKLMYGVHSTPPTLDAIGLLTVPTAFIALVVAKFSKTYLA